MQEFDIARDYCVSRLLKKLSQFQKETTVYQLVPNTAPFQPDNILRLHGPSNGQTRSA
jgi:hypothetical protein